MAMKKATSYDASASALGYLYQCRCALLYALQREDEPTLQVSIEKLDDVAFATTPSTSNPVELLQLKHHASLKRQSSLGNKSLDIWKTLRVWSQGILDGKIDLTRTALFLVTTSVANKSNAIRQLRNNSERDSNTVLTALMKAGKESKDGKVKEAFRTVDSLTEKRRKQLFESITLIDGEDNILDLHQRLERAVRFAVAAEFRSAFLDRLEGWWFRVVVEHLISPNSGGIAVSQIHRQIDELRDQFQRQNLPDDFLDTPVPNDAAPDHDERIFIKQLALIGLSEERVKAAQIDHYKAFAQRARWINDTLLHLGELAQFEGRLADEWRTRFLISLEGVEDATLDDERRGKGLSLYNWTQTDAPSHASLLIRTEFRSQYMTRGSYHMLADQLRVGWHPDYQAKLTPQDSSEAEGDDGTE